MKQFYLLSILISLIFLVSDLNGQNRNLQSILVDVENGRISDDDLGKIPFDENFILRGTKADFVGSIIVKYRIKGLLKKGEDQKKGAYYRKSKHYYFYCEEIDEHGFIQIASVSSTEGTFNILMPPLHPNENYDIVIQFVNNFLLDKNERDDLKNDLFNTIDETFTYGVKVPNSKAIKQLSEAIKISIESKVNNQTIYKKNTMGKLEPIVFTNLLTGNSELSDVKDKISEANHTIYDNIRLMNSRTYSDSITPFILSEIYSIRHYMTKNIKYIVDQKSFKSLREQSVDKLIDPSITVGSILSLLLEDYQRDNQWTSFDVSNDKKSTDEITSVSYLFNLLTGKAKIENNTFVASEKYDLKSVQLLLTTINLIEDKKKANGKPVFSSGTYKCLKPKLSQWIDMVNGISDAEEMLSVNQAKFPDVLEDSYTQWSISSVVPTYVDIESKASPYLGLDFGFLYAPDIQSGFVFESINFHAVPVNRDTKFTQYQGIDKVLKRTSIMVGFAQRVGSYDDNFEKITDAGSPVFGLGYRCHKMIRINGGVLLYKEKNSNPLINDTTNSATYFIAASLDIKLKDITSFVTKLLK